MRKKYLIVHKTKWGKSFASFGCTGRSAWGSLYWVARHLRSRDLSEYEIMTVHATTGAVKVEPAADVIIKVPVYQEYIRRLISREIGVDVDLKGLIDLLQKDMISPTTQAKVIDFLKKHNINY
jgi:hypothetical protein